MRGMLMGKLVVSGVLLSLVSTAWSQPNVDLGQSVDKAKKLVQSAAQSLQPTAPRITQAAADNKTASMPDLLDGASDEAKKEFLDSLTLVDGKVASVKIAQLKRELGPARAREIVSFLNPHPQKTYKVTGTTLGLCNENECDDAACRNKNCVDMKGYMCFSSCP